MRQFGLQKARAPLALALWLSVAVALSAQGEGVGSPAAGGGAAPANDCFGLELSVRSAPPSCSGSATGTIRFTVTNDIFSNEYRVTIRRPRACAPSARGKGGAARRGEDCGDVCTDGDILPEWDERAVSGGLFGNYSGEASDLSPGRYCVTVTRRGGGCPISREIDLLPEDLAVRLADTYRSGRGCSAPAEVPGERLITSSFQAGATSFSWERRAIELTADYGVRYLGTWTAIPGATLASYAPPAETTGYAYRLVVRYDACGQIASAPAERPVRTDRPEVSGSTSDCGANYRFVAGGFPTGADLVEYAWFEVDGGGRRRPLSGARDAAIVTVSGSGFGSRGVVAVEVEVTHLIIDPEFNEAFPTGCVDVDQLALADVPARANFNPGEITGYDGRPVRTPENYVCSEGTYALGSITAGAASCDGRLRYQWYYDADGGEPATLLSGATAPNLDLGGDPAGAIAEGARRSYAREVTCDCAGRLSVARSRLAGGDTSATTLRVANEDLGIVLSSGFLRPNYASARIQVTETSVPMSFRWSDGTVGSAVTLPAGTCGAFEVTGTSSASGCATTAGADLPCIEPIVVEVTTTAPVCPEGDVGRISVTASGGVPPYAVTVDGQPLSEGYAPGTYQVVVRDEDGYFAEAEATVAPSPAAPLRLALSPSPVSCEVPTGGRVTVEVSGGYPPYAVTGAGSGPLTDDGGAFAYLNLTAGRYTYAVTDSRGCTASASTRVGEGGCAGFAPIRVTEISACGDAADGALVLTEFDGCGDPIDYRWADISPDVALDRPNRRSGLAAGTYDVTARRANGSCAVELRFTVGRRGTATLTCLPGETSGPTAADAEVVLRLEGDAPTADVYAGEAFLRTVSLPEGGPATFSLPGYPVGAYDFRAVTPEGCASACTAVVGSRPCALSLAAATATDVTCFGADDGRIDLRPSGSNLGDPDYAVEWVETPGGVDLGGAAVVAGLRPGRYVALVTDGTGCSAERAFAIAEPPPLRFTRVTPAGLLCGDGPDDGAIETSVSGGNGGYVYAWTREGETAPFASANDVSGLPPGTYRLTVTDREGCSVDTAVAIARPPTLRLAIDSLVDADDLARTRLTARASAGTPPYRYEWPELSAESAVVSVPTATTATYTLVVTDANGCRRTGTIEIVAPPTITAEIEPDNVTCFGGRDGRLTAVASGGLLETEGSPSRDYDYRWRDADFRPVGDAAELTDVGAGRYTLDVTDATGTTERFEAEVPGPPSRLSLVAFGRSASCEEPTSGGLSIRLSGGYGLAGASVRVDGDPVALDASGRAELTGYREGAYEVVAADSAGCRVAREAEVDDFGCAGFAFAVEALTRPCAGEAAGAFTLTPVDACGDSIRYDYADPALSGYRQTGLLARDYVVTATRASNSGCSVTDTITVAEYPSLALQTDTLTERLDCSGDADGRIGVTVVDGTAPFAYTWRDAPAVDGARREGLPAGTYYLSVTDANGCAAADSFVIAEPPPLTLDLQGVDPTCGDAPDDGTAVASVDGGTPPYRYAWPNGVDVADDGRLATGLTGGTYALTVTDDRGCSVAEEVTLVNPAPLAVTIAAFRDPAAPARTRLTATATGGTPDLAFLWDADDGDTSRVISVPSTLRPGRTYTVVVRDARGCLAEASYTVEPPPPFVGRVDTGYVSCRGASDARLTVDFAGGFPPYTYAWRVTNGADTLSEDATLEGIGYGDDGEYLVTVTDLAGADTTLLGVVRRPDRALTVRPSSLPASCEEPESGSVSLSVFGGWGGYAVTLDGASADLDEEGRTTRAGLAAGTYAYTVTDARGCVVDGEISVGDFGCAGFAFAVEALTRPCAGEAAGAFTLTPVDACGDSIRYDYADPALSGYRQTGLLARDYVVTATRASNSGCSVTDTITVAEYPSLALRDSVRTDTLACAGDAGGRIAAYAEGGVGPYVFTWSDDPAAGPDRRELGAGTFSLAVVDAVGCTATATYVIAAPPPLTLALDGTDPTCGGTEPDGTLTAVVTGGTGAYRYAWSRNGVSFTPETGTQGAPTELRAGRYRLIVTDANGCTAQADTTLLEPEALAVAIAADRDPAAPATTLLTAAATGGSGAIAFAWSAGSTGDTLRVSSLTRPAVTYVVTARDERGCTATAAFTVEPPPPLTGVLPQGALACVGDRDGALRIDSVAGGFPPYRYAWFAGGDRVDTLSRATTVAGLPAGTYAVVVTDLAGADTTFLGRVVAPETPLGATAVATPASCEARASGTVTLAIAGGWGGYVLTFDDRAVDLASADSLSATATVEGLRAGEYAYLVTDALGCRFPGVVTVGDDGCAGFVVDVASVRPSCGGEATGAIALGPLDACGDTIRYTWRGLGDAADPVVADAGALATGLAAGRYEIRARRGAAASACRAVDTVAVPEAPPVQLACTPMTSAGPTARDGSIRLVASGPAGVYTFLDSLGEALAERTLAAAGDSAVATVDGLARGRYRFSVVGPAGCVDACEAEVEARPCTLVVGLAGGPPSVSCAGERDGVLAIEAGGGVAPYRYTWADTSLTAATRNGLPAGVYVATVSDAVGCVTMAEFAVAAPAPLRLTATVTPVAPDGSGGTVATAAAGGTPPYAFAVAGRALAAAADTTFTGVAAGRYLAAVTDARGCVDTVTVEVVDPCADFLVTLTGVDPACGLGAPNGSLTAAVSGGEAPYALAWSHDSSLVADEATGLPAGSYRVTVTDAYGCTTSAAAVLRQPAPLTLGLEATRTPGTPDIRLRAVASGGTGALAIAWSNGDTGDVTTVSALATATYTATVRDERGCRLDVSYEVTAPAPLTTVASATAVACLGDESGVVILTPAGGLPPYRYVLGAGAPSADRTFVGLPAGAYRYGVLDDLGSEASGEVTVVGPDSALSIALASMRPARCTAPDAGALDLRLGGGFAPYDVAVAGDTLRVGAGEALVLDRLRAGDYAVVVRDAGGCERRASFRVAFDSCADLRVAVAEALATCPNEARGVLAVTAVDACGSALVVDWADLAGEDNPARRTGLPAGDYAVTVRKRGGGECAVRDTLTVPTLPAVTLAATPTPSAGPTATDGSIAVTLEGPSGLIDVYLGDSLALSVTAGTYVIGDLSAGVYRLRARARDGACEDLAEVRVDFVPCDLSLGSSTHTERLACAGEATGRISVVAEGGNAPYAYRWTDADTVAGALRQNLRAGTYTVIVTDRYACVAEARFEIAEPTPVRVTCAPVAADPATLLGEVIAVPSGGTGGFGVSLDGEDLGALPEDGRLRDVAPGPHVVVVTDAAGCSASCTTFVEAAPLQLRLSADTVACRGANTGAVTALPGGGAPPYEITWSLGDSIVGGGLRREGLFAGVYTATLTDRLGGSVSERVIVREPAEPLRFTWLREATRAATCAAPDAGAAQLRVGGGWAGYTLAVAGRTLRMERAGTFDVRELSAGTYPATVTDARGCLTSAVVEIGTDYCAGFSFEVVSERRACAGDATGGLSLTPADACGNEIVYYWADEGGLPGTPSREGLAPGAYVVRAVNPADTNCQLIREVTLSPLPEVRLTCAPGQTSAEGASDGAVDLTLSGEAGPFTVSRDGRVLARDVVDGFRESGLAEGTYVYEVSGANGCRATCSSVVTACERPLGELGFEAATLDVGCGGALGAIVVRGAATGEYEFSLDGGASWRAAGELTGLAAGDYVLLARRRTGATCRYRTEVLTVGTDPVATAEAVEVAPLSACGEDDAAVDVSGEDPRRRLRYSIDGGATWQPTGRFGGLGEGTFIVVVENTASGCRREVGFTVVREGAQVITGAEATPSTDCLAPDGRVRLAVTNATPSTQYRLGRGAWQVDATFAGLPGGSYLAQLRDTLSGCRYTLADSVVVGGTVAAEIAGVTASAASSCVAVDGAIAIAARGRDLTYTIDGGLTWRRDAVFGGLPVGSYTVGVRAEGDDACVVTRVVEVANGFDASVGALRTTDAFSCDLRAGAIAIEGATEPQRFSIDGGRTWRAAPRFDSLTAGTYEVWVAPDDLGCPVSAGSVTIETTPVAPLALGLTVTDATDCGGAAGVVRLDSPEGGVAYAFDGLPLIGGIAAGLPPGEYAIVAQDTAVGCRRDSVRVTVGGLPALGLVLRDQRRPSCYGERDGYVFVDGSGGDGDLRYAWSDGSVGAELGDAAAGDYTVVVTDGRGCRDSLAVTLPTVPAYAAVDSIVFALDECGQAEAGYDLSAYADSLSFAWTYPDGRRETGPVFGTRQEGPHTLTVRSPDGCAYDKPFEVALADSADLPLELLVAATYQLGTGGLVAFEASGVAPDVLTWLIDDPRVRVLSEEGPVIRLEFDEAGTYRIGLRGDFADCTARLTRTITVTEGAPLNPDIIAGVMIESARAYPNPHPGVFRVDVELRREAAVSLEVHDPRTQRVLTRETRRGSDRYDGVALRLPDFSPPGSYILVVRSEGSVRVLQTVKL